LFICFTKINQGEIDEEKRLELEKKRKNLDFLKEQMELDLKVRSKMISN